jgi:CheY-like chemotaxis protein
LFVLLAEDNEVNAVVAMRLLKLLGHQVEHVTDGALAVERVRQRRYDLVLMDVSMPTTGGLEATRQIRAFERDSGTARVPIVGVTAHARDTTRAECAAAGMDGCVFKPLSRVVLEHAISSHVPSLTTTPRPPER